MAVRVIGGGSLGHRRNKLRNLIGKEIFVLTEDERVVNGVLEYRDAHSENQGYYLRGTDVQIPLQHFNQDQMLFFQRAKYLFEVEGSKHIMVVA